ncbi:MAG: radical SAM protein [Nanoarchaeota archaeon]|nr:radical SAM protein [Nanoarchaeota archaeon]
MDIEAETPSNGRIKSNSDGEELVFPTQDIPMGLPKNVQSLCPECTKVIDAVMYEEDGKVFMKKTCSEHGEFKDFISGNVEFWLKMERTSFEDGPGFGNPQTKYTGNCPTDCGICDHHLSNACLANIDLTNRCNLNCPVCFANANKAGYVCEPSLEDVRKIVKTLVNTKPNPCTVVQFSGGEPSIHPQVIEIMKMAKEEGMKFMQMATNGVRLAGDDGEFAKKCVDAGLQQIYLQFDGTNEEVYKKTRGNGKLWKIKQKCIENCRKAGLKVVFVPTIIKGVNDNQVWDILQYAIDNIDVMNGVSYQPVSFCGRLPQDEIMNTRYTMTDIVEALERGSKGKLMTMRDWYPLSFGSPMSKLLSANSGKPVMTITNHAQCGAGAYILVNRDTKETIPLSAVFDFERIMLEINELVKKAKTSKLSNMITKIKGFNILRKYWKAENAPEDLSFMTFMKTLEGMLNGNRVKDEKWILLVVLGMHFQDKYSFRLDRVRRCVIHYGAPDGKIYPFCTYNAGPTFREKIEKEYSIPLEEWKRRNANVQDFKPE